MGERNRRQKGLIEGFRLNEAAQAEILQCVVMGGSEIKKYVTQYDIKEIEMDETNGAVGKVFEEVLLPEIRIALARGAEYGETWKKHINPDIEAFENVKHTIDVHVLYRIADALQKLDWNHLDSEVDLEPFIKSMASAVGYMANSILKAKHLYEDYKP